jgi:uncharacterized protein
VRRVVLDPNVFISALIAPKGASARVLDAWLSGVCDAVVSRELLAELERVLMRPKFRPYLSETEVRSYLSLIQATALQTADPARTESLSPDPGDDYLVALAESVRADCLVSGDKHLLGLERIGLNVLNPAAFLELLKL